MIHYGGYNILRSSDRDSWTCFDIADNNLYGGTNRGDIIICSLVYGNKNKLKIVTDYKVTPPCDSKLNVKITCIAISPCKKYLSIGNCNGVVVVFSIIKKDLLQILYSYDEHKGSISVLKWSKFESHKLFSGGIDGVVIELNCQRLLESNKLDSIDILNHYLKSFISLVGNNSKILTTVCQCNSAVYYIDCETIYCHEYVFDAVIVCCHNSVYIFHLPIQSLHEQPKFSLVDNKGSLGCGYFCCSDNETSGASIMIFKNSYKSHVLQDQHNNFSDYVILNLYDIDGNFQEEVLISKLGNIKNKEILIRSIHKLYTVSYLSKTFLCVSENRDLLYLNLSQKTIEVVESTNSDYFNNCTISVRTVDSNIFILHEYPTNIEDVVLLIGVDILSLANSGFNDHKGYKRVVIHSYLMYFNTFIKLQKRWRRYFNDGSKSKLILKNNSNVIESNLNDALETSDEQILINILPTVPSILDKSIMSILPHSQDLSVEKSALQNNAQKRISSLLKSEINLTCNTVPPTNMYENVESNTEKSIANITGLEVNEFNCCAFNEYDDIPDSYASNYDWLKDTAGTWTEKWNDNKYNILKSKLCSRRNVTNIECTNRFLVSWEDEAGVDFFISKKLNRQYSVTLSTTKGIGLILSIDTTDDNSNVIFVQGFHRSSNGNPSPAKESGLIDIGDYLIGVNDIDLRSSTIDEIIAILNKDNDDYFNAELRLIFEYNDGCAHNFNETEVNIRDTMSSNSSITAEASENFRKIILWNNRDLGIIIEKTLNALDPVVDWLIPLDLQGNCLKAQSANFNSSPDANEADIHFLYMKQRHLYPSVVSLTCVASDSDSNLLARNQVILDIFNDSWEWRSWYSCANESHHFYWENYSPFLYPLEDTGIYKFTKTFSWNESTGEYACNNDLTDKFAETTFLNHDLYVQALRGISVGRFNSTINSIKSSTINCEFIIRNDEHNFSYLQPSLCNTQLNKPLKHLDIPKVAPNALELLNIFKKSASQVIDNFPNVTNTLQLLFLLNHSDNLLQNCSKENEKFIQSLLVYWLKTFNPLPLTERSRLHNIYHNYLDSKMRGFSSGAEYHEFIEVVADISTLYYLLLTNRQNLRCDLKRLNNMNIIDKMQLKYLPYYLLMNDINVANDFSKSEWDEDECISFIKLYGCYVDLDFTAASCSILCYPRTLSTIHEIVSNDEEYMKYFIDIQKYIRNQQKNIKADDFLSNVLSTCGSYYELKYCLLIQLLGLVFKSNEELGIELGLMLFPIIRCWNVKFALVGSMHDKFMPPTFNDHTDSFDGQYDMFEFNQVFENKDSFVGSRATMKNETKFDPIEIGSNINNGEKNHDENSTNINEWFYSRRKIYHRYLIKLLFCATLDNYSNTVTKNKNLLIEWIYLSFYLITCKIDLTVSVSQEIRYRITDNLIMQNLLILFPIPSDDINDTSIYQFRITSKFNIENDEVYTFADNLLGMNDIVSSICIKIIVNYSNILELDPLFITDLCMKYGLYGCAIKAHEKYMYLTQENDNYEDIDLSVLWKILSDSLLILWYDGNYSHISATIITEAINLVTKNLYHYGKHKNDDIIFQLSIFYNEAFNQFLFTQSYDTKQEDVTYVACIYCDIIFDAVGLQVGLSIINHANYLLESIPLKYIQNIYCKLSK